MHYDGITYAEIQGFRPLLLDLHMPAGSEAAPVVVWIHGGAFWSGDRRYLPETMEPGSVFEALIAAGIGCATIDYRLSGEAIFPAQLDDVITAVDYLQEYADVLGIDGARIGMWGESAGGTLAALAGLTDPRISAVVGWYPVTDMLAGNRGDRDDEDEVIGALLGAQPRDVPELAAQASAVTQVSAGAPPFLLIHGAVDTMVPPAHSERLHELLLKAGERSTYRPIAGADHCFAGYADVPGIIADSAAFFAAEL